MNRNFAHTISVLRHERGLSQKTAATDLGISQALLSHYEKGIRECGLEFVVKLADYYGVTADYLLGRTAHRQTEESRTLPPAEETGDDPLADDKLRATAALSVVFAVLRRVREPQAAALAMDALTQAVYRVWRAVYCLNGRSTLRAHRVPEAQADSTAAAAETLALQRLRRIAASGRGEPMFTDRDYSLAPEALVQTYPGQAESLLELTEDAEDRLLDLLQPQ